MSSRLESQHCDSCMLRKMTGSHERRASDVATKALSLRLPRNPKENEIS